MYFTSMVFGKKILFTGAGFTADFGGFLATEMWSKIFSNKKLEGYKNIREALREDVDFEFVYWLVMADASYSADERNVLKEVIAEAYGGMDTNIIPNLNKANLGKLLTAFAGDSSTVSAHFTLNQDLFMERRARKQPLGIAVPKYKEYLEEIQQQRIDTSHRIQLPDDEFIRDFERNHMDSAGSSYYIKLHGSYGWLSADGSNAMVIGYGKQKHIAREPLLKWYFELFSRAINSGNAKILIIGYGFGDTHINIELAKAVKNSGLKIHLLSPEHPKVIKEKISDFYVVDPADKTEIATDCSVIWHAIEEYHPYKVMDVFPKDGSSPNSQHDLLRAFL